MIVTIIALFITISIATVITERFKFKQESSILMTFLSMATFIYISGLFNLMKYAVYFIYLLAIISFIYNIYCLLKKKIKIKEIFTPGTCFYIVVTLAVTLMVLDTNYYHWDEFSHWGANLKAMVKYDLFWANNIYDGVHVVYTPLAGIVEYFFCKLNGGFAEDVSYIGINFFIITLLLPICQNEKFNIKNFIKLAIFWITAYVVVILCNFSISSIYIDLLLGILFTTGMYLAFRLNGKEDKINLFLILISMPLLKDSGLLLLGIILMQLFFSKIVLKLLEDKKITKDNFKKLGILVAILAISLTLYGTWKIYCSANNRYLDDRHDKNAISQIDLKEYIKAILLIKTNNPKYVDIARSFYDNLNANSVIGNDGKGISTIKIVIILNLISAILYLINNDKKIKKKILVLLASFDIGFVLYCLLLLATFMFAFTETEGRNLASYSRYMSTYLIGWILVSFSIAINSKNKNQILIGFMSLMMCLYLVNFTSVLDVTSRKGVTGLTEDVKLKADIIQEKVDLNEKVYLIYQHIGGGYNYHKLRYCISPIVTNLMYEWSLGPKYYDTDIWSYDITKEEFEKKLIDEQFDYVFIAQIDEQFIDIYGDLIQGNYTEENMEELNNKLLKVNKINENEVILNVVN